MTDVLSTETVALLRDAGPKDLLWLICDSHELLRAERDEARQALAEIERLTRPSGKGTSGSVRVWRIASEAAGVSAGSEGAQP